MKFASYLLLVCLSVSLSYAYNSWKDISSNCELNKEVENAGNKLMVVEFYARWCGPARRMNSPINAIARKPENSNVVFLKMDAEKCESLTDQYEVKYSPSFVFLRNGTNLKMMATSDSDEFETDLNLYRNTLDLNNSSRSNIELNTL